MAYYKESALCHTDMGKSNDLGGSGSLSTFTIHTFSDNDQLFLRFHGPTTILLQTRASRVSDVLTTRDVDEIADTQPGVVEPLVSLRQESSPEQRKPSLQENVVSPTMKFPQMRTASIDRDGKVTFEGSSDSKS